MGHVLDILRVNPFLSEIYNKPENLLHFAEEKKEWQRWDSNPRLRRDWCLKPAP